MIQTRYSYANAVISDDDQSLQGIHEKNKNIAIYQRDIKPLRKELDQIKEQQIECRVSGTVDEIISTLKTYFDTQLTPHTALLNDITEIVVLFEKISQSSSFRLMLATVSTDMCRKFHTDINNLRLLCTYIGPGTLWLPDEAVNQRALQSRKGDQNIVKEGHSIQQVDTGDVVILKGALYPDSNPIMHRSPAIEKNRAKRLLLRIDTNSFLNFDI